MSENPEVGYWQAVVDDQRVANERLNDELTDARAEIARLREIVAAATIFISKTGGPYDDANAAFNKLAALVNTYLENKTS